MEHLRSQYERQRHRVIVWIRSAVAGHYYCHQILGELLSASLAGDSVAFHGIVCFGQYLLL